MEPGPNVFAAICNLFFHFDLTDYQEAILIRDTGTGKTMTYTRSNILRPQDSPQQQLKAAAYFPCGLFETPGIIHCEISEEDIEKAAVDSESHNSLFRVWAASQKKPELLQTHVWIHTIKEVGSEFEQTIDRYSILEKSLFRSTLDRLARKYAENMSYEISLGEAVATFYEEGNAYWRGIRFFLRKERGTQGRILKLSDAENAANNLITLVQLVKSTPEFLAFEKAYGAR
ncbi:MAG TPA: hypothetical protein VFQ60_04655 [Patescibacteria group bacterium]|nr:hypothetical protein [Patescibacteria group bacterium]